MTYQINLGLCCINNSLRSDGRDWLLSSGLIQKRPRAKVEIFCSRSTPRSHYTLESAKTKALDNTRDLLYLLQWNHQHNIKHLRISSDMFPRFTDPKVESYTIDFAIDNLKIASEYAKQHQHRLTFHPGQFNQIGAKNPDVFESTCKDLKHHADIFDVMDIDQSGILCIHGGGMYGDKESAMRLWIEQFDDLHTSVKRRIAIENCEKCYTVRDCLHMADACKIPVILDTHHYLCYNILHPDIQQESLDDMLPEVVDSWSRYNCRPLFHISDQAENKPIGSHHDYIKEIPNSLLQLSIEHEIDIEVEAKAKEVAILQLKKQYNI